MNLNGELGNGTIGEGSYADPTAPVAVRGGRTFTALVAGAHHTCGLVSGGTAYCWGSNEHGQLGDGTGGQTLVPVAVSGGRTFTALVAGFAHTCGLVSGGTAYCWGYNAFGQLGDGTAGGLGGQSRANRTAPVAVSGGLPFTALVAGGYHTCGLVSGGTAYCWGWNQNGQIGDVNLGAYRMVPVAVSGGRTFTALVAGYLHTCGTETGGTTYCWGQGYNLYGQLGGGTGGNGDWADHSANRTASVAVIRRA